MVKTIEPLVEEISNLLDRSEVKMREYKLNLLESGEDRVTNECYSLDCFSCNPSPCYSCVDCYSSN